MSKRRKVVSSDETHSPYIVPKDTELKYNLTEIPNFEKNILPIIDEYLTPRETINANYHQIYVAAGLSFDYGLAFQCAARLCELDTCKYLASKACIYEDKIRIGLISGSKNGELEFVKYMAFLLKQLAIEYDDPSDQDVDEIVKECIFTACKFEKFDVVKYLVTVVEEDYNAMIQTSSNNENFELVKWLTCIETCCGENEQKQLKDTFSCDDQCFEYVISLAHENKLACARYLFYQVSLFVCCFLLFVSSYKFENSLLCTSCFMECVI